MWALEDHVDYLYPLSCEEFRLAQEMPCRSVDTARYGRDFLA